MLLFIFLILFIGYFGYEGVLIVLFSTALSYQDKTWIKIAAAAVFVLGNVAMIDSIIHLLL